MNYTRLQWRDGQPYSEQFDDVYCSSHVTGRDDQGGEGEFQHVFFAGNRLLERWRGDADRMAGFTIAELGFGSGLNFLLTAREWLNRQQQDEAVRADPVSDHPVTDHDGPPLNYIAIEKYPLSPDDIGRITAMYPGLGALSDELRQHYPPAVRGSHVRYLFEGRIRVCFCFMDALDALEGRRFAVDAWYLDGFTPSKNTSMWTADLLTAVAGNSRASATFATYTAAGDVRRNLQAVGFRVDRAKGYGNKREMLKGQLLRAKSLAGELPASEQRNDEPYGREAGKDEGDYRLKDKPWNRLPDPENQTDGPVAIIGAGVAGLCIADALCRRGRQVTIIDRQPGIAQATSSNPAAIVYPRLSIGDHASNAFFSDAFSYAVSFLDDLQREQSLSFWFKTGLQQLVEKDRLDKILSQDIFCDEWLCAHLQDDVQYALLPTAGYVLPALLCEALYHRCGSRLDYIQADIDAVSHADGRWCCYSKAEEISSSTGLVIATNFPLSFIADDEMAWLDIDRVGGQSVSVAADAYTSSRIQRVVNAGNYITPEHDGLHHVGASYRTAQASMSGVDDTETAGLLDAFGRFVAAQGDYRAESVWVGERAIARDRMPVIGACPDADFFYRYYSDVSKGDARKRYPAAAHRHGLFLSLGHGSRGFTTSYIAAEIIASQLCGDPLPVTVPVMNVVSAARLLIRALKGS